MSSVINPRTEPGGTDVLGALEQYWAEILAPLTGTCAVSLDFPRGPEAPLTPPAEIQIPVPASVSTLAMRASDGKPPRLSALLIAASKALVRRQSGVDQVCVLTPVADDGQGETRTNRWLAVKTEIDPHMTAAGLLQRVAHNLAGAFAHQDFPFARVIELMGRVWPSNRAPLSDLAAAFEGVSRMDVLRDLATDVTVVGSIGNGSLQVRIAYRGDLFRPETIRSFGHRLVRVLEALLVSPARSISDLALMSSEEETDAIARFTTWELRELPDCRVENLVTAAAQMAPEQPAFTQASTTLTYGDLVARARCFARNLRRAGVQPGDRVAVALDLGLPLPIALLGTLFCGAAFVPMDPRHPRTRLQAILKQVEPAIVVAEERLKEHLQGRLGTIECSATSPSDAGAEFDAEPGSAGGQDIAYVMFTSGSTGEPNGVAVSHRSLLNYLLWAKDHYLGGQQPTFALFTSISFDLTLTSAFLPLIANCSTVIFEHTAGVPDMKAIFTDPRVEFVKATPSHLKALRPSDLERSSVRFLVAGGEALEWDVAALLQGALGPTTAIFNEYGPTEATIACSAFKFEPADPRAATVSIGRPIWNTGLYLLDNQGKPVPDGVPGNLWVSGQPVAEGYFQRPERTAERFVADPFVTGSRMYATGDRARYDTLGRLHFLGRDDDQAKFNGVRIELGEIRSALGRLPRVRDSIVRILEDERGNQVMVAYYVSRQTIDLSLLLSGLAELLPHEMMPNLFFRMASLPLTLNGKIDTDRLPGLEEVRAKASRTFVAPRTPTEKALADVWSETLGVSEISVHSNFFELGGHSLLASQVVWKISERLGVETPLRVVFDAPTIAQLAAFLDERPSDLSALRPRAQQEEP